MAPLGQPDEVLEALDHLLVVLREDTRRNQLATRRAQTIRRLRSHGRSYQEILGRVSAESVLGITRESADCVAEATERLHDSEVNALHREGLSVDDIAVLCGTTAARVSAVLADVADPHDDPPPRPELIESLSQPARRSRRRTSD